MHIENCKKNIMGTVSFDGRFQGMRKAQDFIVYPLEKSGPVIRVQSESRFGQINLDTGEVVMSAATTRHPNSSWLAQCVYNRTATVETLPAEETATLRQAVKATGGLLVGESFVKSDNMGAMAL
jgi:hypothetical protein